MSDDPRAALEHETARLDALTDRLDEHAPLDLVAQLADEVLEASAAVTRLLPPALS